MRQVPGEAPSPARKSRSAGAILQKVVGHEYCGKYRSRDAGREKYRMPLHQLPAKAQAGSFGLARPAPDKADSHLIIVIACADRR